jgi:hypothetical protein
MFNRLGRMVVLIQSTPSPLPYNGGMHDFGYRKED